MMRKFLAGMAGLAVLTGVVTCTAWAQARSKTQRRSNSTAHRTATHAAVHRSLLNPASLNQKAPASYKVRFTTTQGPFVVEVTRAWAPLGADRFYNLVKNGYYTDASFFRVLPNFVVQFGISAKPAVSKAWARATIPDDAVTQSNKPGYLTFATAGPNTRTTQIFINLGDNAALDGQGFAPFGQVTEGMDVVGKLYSGYGEGAPQGNGPDQGRIEAEGKAYLDKEFPRLDSIRSAVIVPAAPAAKKPSAASSHGASAKPK
jgi:cyclophilin family peptidyl-prolyl cis-trans isomerase